MKELEAQQQLTLGMSTAELAFEKLLKSAEAIGDSRQKKFLGRTREAILGGSRSSGDSAERLALAYF